MTPSRNRGGRKRLADSLPPDGPVTRPSPVPLITDPGTPRSAVSHSICAGGIEGGRASPVRETSAPLHLTLAAQMLQRSCLQRPRHFVALARIITPARHSRASDFSVFERNDFVRPSTCSSSSQVPAPTPAPSRLKNPLQYTSPSRSSRIQDSTGAPKQRQCFKTRQLHPSGLVLRANTTTSSNDPSIYNTRIKLTTPLPRNIHSP